ncbi:hypothetical protein Anapl_02327 [Anas platyrhynchos]|uniref:Uncharacterized protein n=1 Tax=Anas platyrhynchos TaxID=8839 RepID=R0LL98_ANAPL|nr:hypothetical protein Anapl_02327 [Anas platyrhynchos]
MPPRPQRQRAELSLYCITQGLLPSKPCWTVSDNGNWQRKIPRSLWLPAFQCDSLLEGLPCHTGIHQPVFSTRVCRWGSHEADCAKTAKGGSALTHVTTNLWRFITTGSLFTQRQPQEKQTQAAAVGTVMTIWCNSYSGKLGQHSFASCHHAFLCGNSARAKTLGLLSSSASSSNLQTVQIFQTTVCVTILLLARPARHFQRQDDSEGRTQAPEGSERLQKNSGKTDSLEHRSICSPLGTHIVTTDVNGRRSMLNGLLDQVLVPSWLPTSSTSSAADHLRANPVAEDGMGNNKKKKKMHRNDGQL